MDDELEDCKEQNRKLEEENELLRESAETFGALADRLNEKLQPDPPADPSESDSSKDPGQK
jgi:hypothetical protein